MPRLLAAIAGIVVAIGGGTAIAVAATSGGPVPKPKALSAAIRDALRAKPVQGISADVSFTNGLIPSAEIQGTDQLLTGGSGHIWISGDGQLRLELYGDNGDPEVVVNHTSWWVYDPTLQTVYEGKLPASTGGPGHSKSDALPTIAQIQADINRLMGHVNVSGAVPGDVGGQPAYTVTVSPKRDGGMLGQLQLAWDAVRGVPLRFAVYARGNNSPVLELKATGVSYGAIDPGVFNIAVPTGVHVVDVATPAATPATQAMIAGKGAKRHHADVTGVKAVAGKVSFPLAAPRTLDGLQRQSVSLVDLGDSHGALVAYGQGVGGIAVIEQPATANSSQRLSLSSGSGDHANGLALPTVTINGATGQELDTTLGTIVRFTRGGVTYTVMGSVPPYAADAAARGL
jgi:outer membrane lipoprotein-sorting protein